MPTLEILDISGNIEREKKDEKSIGIKSVLEGIMKIKSNLRKLLISRNKGINNDGTLNVLMQFISESRSLKQLEISNMGMDAKNCKEFSEFLLKEFAKDWNLNSSVREITWDQDFKVDAKTAKKWMTESMLKVYNLRLTKLRMAEVFDEKDHSSIIQ